VQRLYSFKVLAHSSAYPSRISVDLPDTRASKDQEEAKAGTELNFNQRTKTFFGQLNTPYFIFSLSGWREEKSETIRSIFSTVIPSVNM
jgi:hypothetical protein